MTQEDKQLLLKDICARLPYGVKMQISEMIPEWFAKKYGKGTTVTPFTLDASIMHFIVVNINSDVKEVKPYLRPMSSMTEEEEKEFNHVFELELAALEEPAVGHTIKSAASNAFVIDFYNRHHFDFRGLIPMGLALEAPEGMYKF